MSFSYIGEAKTGAEFISYVKSYDFGKIPPSFVVIHHSADPDASWAPYNGDPAKKWDRNEAGLSNDQIKAKRKPQLDAIMRYYRDVKGWTSGPHLFCDERWIWLFTPMYDVGTHAASGNSFHDANDQLQYSIGVETVGYFENNGWPQSMQRLLQIALQTLRDTLGTFQITYTSAPVNRPDLHNHQIAFHRDFNKPACPGAVITPQYAIPILSKPFGSLYPRYTIVAPCTVFQSPDPDGALADGPNSGQTQLAIGTEINAVALTDPLGWLWVSPNTVDKPGIGFIPIGYASPK